MLNRSGINKTEYAGPTQILANVQMQYSVGCIVNEELGSNGIVKAGTPIQVNTLDIQEPANESASPNAVLLHDVNVSNGNANGTALLFGSVNLNRLDDDVAQKLEDVAPNGTLGQIFLVRL